MDTSKEGEWKFSYGLSGLRSNPMLVCSEVIPTIFNWLTPRKVHIGLCPNIIPSLCPQIEPGHQSTSCVLGRDRFTLVSLLVKDGSIWTHVRDFTGKADQGSEGDISAALLPPILSPSSSHIVPSSPCSIHSLPTSPPSSTSPHFQTGPGNWHLCSETTAVTMSCDGLCLQLL